jgi:hypothetical protein
MTVKPSRSVKGDVIRWEAGCILLLDLTPVSGSVSLLESG